MDTGFAVMGIILLLLCVLPFIIIRKNRKKRDKKYKETISSLAGESNNQIDLYDGWKSTIIGLDSLNRKLFFLRKVGDKDVHIVVDLADIHGSKVLNTRWSLKGESNGMTQKLELGLTPREKSKPIIRLEFFNADCDGLTMMDELLIAEKWSALINSTISKNGTT
jgi:preprotein translocase subunit YajC